jgi:polysaccharide chain length determinant protein (PEP-CTERM system associated)
MPLLPKMGLREYGLLFLRRKWMVVFSFLFILLAASVYCVATPELYRSETTILIIPQSVPQDYVRSTVSVKVEQQLATIKQQVMSRTTLMKVMEELRLFEKERKELPPEEVVELMRKRVGIEVVQGKPRDSASEAFTLSFQHEDPKSAMNGAARLASFFIDENLKTREQQAVGTSEFLDSQLKETKEKLEVLEEKVKEYKMRFMGELPQQMEANLRMLTGLQDRLRSNESNARALEDRKVYLEAQLGLMEKSIPAGDNGQALSSYGPNPSLSLEGQLALKRARLAELNSKYTAQYPTVVAARQEVAELEKRVAESRGAASLPSDGKPPGGALPAQASFSPGGMEELRRMKAQVTSSELEIASLKREKITIEKNIASVEQKIERSPKREQEMISLIRDYENQKQSYDDLLKKKLEADVSQNLEKRQKGTQFQILDPANLPQESFRPDRRKGMLIGLLLAFAVGFGGPVFRESMDLTLHDVRSFKHLYKAQILGTLPAVQGPESRKKLALRRAAVIGGLVTFTVVLSVFLIAYHAKIRTILNY